jgi:hypothetical protein
MSIKRAERDELDEHDGNCCEVPEHARDAGDSFLHDLGDVGVIHHLSEDET